MLDCTNCTKKHNTAAQGHCTEFHMKPQIDDCAQFSSAATARAATPIAIVPVEEKGHYIGLDREKESATTTPQ